MRAAILLAGAALTLTACGQSETRDVAEPTPAAAPAPVVAAAPVDLATACRDAVKRMFGQEGDAVTFTAAGEGRVEVSWRAPVDGGVLSFECRADGDSVSLSRESRRVSTSIQMTAPAVEKEAR